jgi:para-aminobenzoate synthetase component 1
MSRVLFEEIGYRDPLAAFAAFAALPGATFLDSARPDGAQARYSFITAEPFLTLKSRDGLIEEGEVRDTGDPFQALAQKLAL